MRDFIDSKWVSHILTHLENPRDYGFNTENFLIKLDVVLLGKKENRQQIIFPIFKITDDDAGWRQL